MKISPFWRNTLIVLVLANVLWWAWAHDHLRLLGMGPTPVAEPQRLGQQVNPEALTLRPSGKSDSNDKPQGAPGKTD